jgi:hypothetical protein
MRRRLRYGTLLGAAALCLLCGPLAAAEIKTEGTGDAMTFDPSGFRDDMKPKFEIMKVKCVKCHTMERTIIAVRTGIAPISGQPFDRNATKAYGVKMMRKPDSDMNKEQVKAVVELLNYLLDEAAR